MVIIIYLMTMKQMKLKSLFSNGVKKGSISQKLIVFLFYILIRENKIISLDTHKKVIVGLPSLNRKKRAFGLVLAFCFAYVLKRFFYYFFINLGLFLLIVV